MRKISNRKQTVFVFISKYTTVFTSIAITSVLARLITPEEFGIVAVISIFTTFFNILADIGVGTAIVQNRDLSTKDINMIFTLNLYSAIILSFVFVVLSFFICELYANNIYISLGVILAISLFFNMLNTIPNALLMREEHFIFTGYRNIICNIVSGIVAIYSAYRGVGCFALVIQTLSYSLINFGMNFSKTSLKIEKKIDFSCMKKVKEFSVYWFGFNLLNYFARNLDSLITGKILGERALGYYDKAYKLMLYPVQNLTYVLNPILHPILAKYQDDLGKIYFNYIKVLKVLSLLGIYISAFCLFNSREIIIVFFGPQWEESIIAFKILSCSIWFQITNSSTGAIYASTNKTKLLLKSGSTYIPIQALLFVVGSFFRKIEVMAFAATLGLIIKFFVDYIMLIKKGFGYHFSSFLKLFKYEPFIFIIIYICMLLGSRMKIENNIFILIYNLLISSIAFLVCIFCMGEIRYIKDLVRK